MGLSCLWWQRILVVILLTISLSSCAYKRILVADIEGKEIKTPYGKADGDFYYKSLLCLGAGSNDCKEFKDNRPL